MDTENARGYEEHGIQAYRIERGADVIGTDGSLGTVEQIVVDGDTGQLQSLVVRGEAGMFMELPAARIESATGEKVYLSIGRADLAAHPELARPFKPELYIPVDEGAVVPPSEVIARDPDAPVLTEMEDDAVEIAAPAEEDGEELLDDEADEGADLADQPTIVLSPDDASELQADGRQGIGALPGIAPEPLSVASDEVAAVADVEIVAMPEPMAPAPAATASQPTPPGASSRWPRGTEGSAYGDLVSSGIGTYVTAGILAGTAAASIAYLVWSRRQRERTRRRIDLGDLRARLDGMRAAGAMAQQTLGARARGQATQMAHLAQQMPKLNAQGTQAAYSAGSRLSDLRDLLAGRLEGVGETLSGLVGVASLANRARDTLRSTARGLPALDDARETLVSRLGSLAEDAQNRLDDATDAVRGWRPDLGSLPRPAELGIRLALPSVRVRPLRRAAGAVAKRAATKAVSSKVEEAGDKAKGVSLAARRRMTRMGRRLRWFRRGLMAGAAWGVLYAPVPGREARATAARYLQRVPYLRDYVGAGEEVSGAVGSTGPHPRSDLATSRNPYASALGDTPLLEPESEEPLLPSPEGDVGSLPGGAPKL